MKKILIVGGGMGGTILANNLARRLNSELKAGKVRITMLSASDKHMYQPGLLYLAVGKITPDCSTWQSARSPPTNCTATRPACSNRASSFTSIRSRNSNSMQTR